MKLQEFDQLCKTEWQNGKGEVVTLWLLEKSVIELQDDIASYGHGGGKVLPLRMEDLPQLRMGGRPMYVVNPVTREIVKMRIARDMDVADVRMPGGRIETHILSRS